MQRCMIITILILIIFICQLSILHCQSWKELIDSGRFYQSRQEYEHTLACSKKALVQAEKEFGKLDTNYANTLNLIYSIYYNLGENDSALIYCKRELDISRKIYKSGHKYLASNLIWLGDIYNSIGELDSAEMDYKEALEILRGLPKADDWDFATVLNNLSLVYITKGNFPEAESLLIESLELRRRLYHSDNPSVANSLLNLAELYYSMGRYSEAGPLLEEALTMNRHLYKGDQYELSMSINNLASFYNIKGKFSEAEALYKEALEMNRRLYKDNHPNLAMSINNMAGFYNKIGRYALAEQTYLEVLLMSRQLYKGDHPNLAVCLNNIAYFYDGRRKQTEAEKFYKEALDMKRRINKSDNPDLARSINNLAKFYLDRKRYSEAEPLLIESLEMSRRIYKNDHPDLSSCLSNMALYYNYRGKQTEAERLYIEALEMRRRLYKCDNADLAKSIYNLANFYNEKAMYKEAESLYIESLNMLNNIVFNYFPSLSEREKEQFWVTVKDEFEFFNSFAVKRMKDNPNILCYLFDNQLSTKAILFNSIDKIRSRILYSGDTVLIKKYKKWIASKEYLIKLYTFTNEKLIKAKINLDSLESIANELEKEISLKSEPFAKSYEKKKVNWRIIQGLLKPDEAAIEVIRFRNKDKNNYTDTICYAFLIITDQTTEHPELVILENGKDLESSYYNQYRFMIYKKMQDIHSFKRYWSKLYEKIKIYKKIYFSPDGIYYKMNPSTFLLPNLTYLIDLQDIQIVNSTKDLLFDFFRTKHETNIYNNAVLVGNPNFSLPKKQLKEKERLYSSIQEKQLTGTLPKTIRELNLVNLPGTEKEVKEIEKFLKDKKWDVKTYLKDDAIKGAIKMINSPRVLHFATHGYFLPVIKSDTMETLGFETEKIISNPLLRSGIFLAGALSSINDKMNPIVEDNGILTAYEAMNLNLDHTELVVLSSCESGLGEVQNGEGVYGLRRAFQQAGARTVTMSLWIVSDKATHILMSKFYENWVSGMTKREAFSKAQQDIRNTYKEPYYWGAFVMVGE